MVGWGAINNRPSRARQHLDPHPLQSILTHCRIRTFFWISTTAICFHNNVSITHGLVFLLIGFHGRDILLVYYPDKVHEYTTPLSFRGISMSYDV